MNGRGEWINLVPFAPSPKLVKRDYVGVHEVHESGEISCRSYLVDFQRKFWRHRPNARRICAEANAVIAGNAVIARSINPVLRKNSIQEIPLTSSPCIDVRIRDFPDSRDSTCWRNDVHRFLMHQAVWLSVSTMVLSETRGL